MSPRVLSCLLLKQLFNNENTHSEAAEEGCSNTIFLAAADQLGSSEAFDFHHYKGQIAESTSIALAKYTSSSALRFASVSPSKNG